MSFNFYAIGDNNNISTPDPFRPSQHLNLFKQYFLFIFSGESGDSSLVVSLEINSVMYQGVLFAQPGSLGSSKKISSSANTAATTGIDRSNINKDVHKI